jgi:hypothetical protein
MRMRPRTRMTMATALKVNERVARELLNKMQIGRAVN